MYFAGTIVFDKLHNNEPATVAQYVANPLAVGEVIGSILGGVRREISCTTSAMPDARY